MITGTLLFIAGLVVGALITLNNTRKVKAICEKLEEEASELRDKVKNRQPRVD